MVQEYQSPVRVYEYSFEMVMLAYEKRFPTCKMIPAFLGSEVTYEYVSDDNAIHIVERRCKLNVDAPYLLKKIAGVDHAVFIQRNSLNRRDRTLKIEARNESFSSRLIIKENCYYSVHPDNPQWTIFEQDASLDVINFFGFEQAVEKLAIKAYTSNLKKGKEIIMYYINELHQDGVTYVPPFQGSEGRPRCVSHVERQGSHEVAAENSTDLEDEAIDENLVNVEAAKVEEQPELPVLETDSHGIPTDLEKIKDIVEPPPVQEYKLEDSYIARYLGELTMIEESRLMQLRRRLQLTHQGKLPDESVMLRFLRARDCNLDKAFEMLKNSLHWRRQHHVDHILETWNPPSALLEYYPGGWHKYDKDGRPLYVIRLGTMDIKGLMRSVGEDGFVKQVVATNEEALKKCREATVIFNKPITSWTCLCDLEGLSMRHLWRPGVRALLKIIEVVEANYPETMGRILIVRAPKVFGVVWTLLYPFIDENTRKKFLIYTGDDYQAAGGLADYVPAEYVPSFLGGTSECHVLSGRPVPKSFYRYASDADASDSSWLGSDMYQTAQVVKGSPHDVILTISEAESVITWDFDVTDGECVFHVLRHKRPREVASVQSPQLSDSSTEQQHIRLGIDATVVEKPITCLRGESIQGSHICQQPGVYILQWKLGNPASAKHQGLRLQSKAKIMYYCEVLPSRNFKGSLSSITSSTSGFSQLSMTSLNQSAGSSGIVADISPLNLSMTSTR